MALLTKAHRATGPTNGLQSESEIKDPTCLFTEHREPVACWSTRCFIWFHTGGLSPWASPSLGLCGSLEGACAAGGSCDQKQGPTHTGKGFSFTQLKHHYANELATPAHLRLPAFPPSGPHSSSQSGGNVPGEANEAYLLCIYFKMLRCHWKQILLSEGQSQMQSGELVEVSRVKPCSECQAFHINRV